MHSCATHPVKDVYRKTSEGRSFLFGLLLLQSQNYFPTIFSLCTIVSYNHVIIRYNTHLFLTCLPDP